VVTQVDHPLFRLWLFQPIHFPTTLKEKGASLMQPRLNPLEVFPAAYQAMASLETFVRQSSKLEPSLVALVKMRASQVNGCAYCIDMHSKDARIEGETEQRLYALSAWRETPFFTERERAALSWTEAVTMIAKDHVPDEVYRGVKEFFSDEELVNLTLAVVAINGWNRLAIAFRAVPGEYQPGMHKTKGARQ
jgi:AhpD family alkylhydroperoxidase